MRLKKDFGELLEIIQAALDEEVLKMKERFLIKKIDVGLGTLWEAMVKDAYKILLDTGWRGPGFK